VGGKAKEPKAEKGHPQKFARGGICLRERPPDFRRSLKGAAKKIHRQRQVANET